MVTVELYFTLHRAREVGDRCPFGQTATSPDIMLPGLPLLHTPNPFADESDAYDEVILPELPLTQEEPKPASSGTVVPMATTATSTDEDKREPRKEEYVQTLSLRPITFTLHGVKRIKKLWAEAIPMFPQKLWDVMIIPEYERGHQRCLWPEECRARIVCLSYVVRWLHPVTDNEDQTMPAEPLMRVAHTKTYLWSNHPDRVAHELYALFFCRFPLLETMGVYERMVLAILFGCDYIVESTPDLGDGSECLSQGSCIPGFCTSKGDVFSPFTREQSVTIHTLRCHLAKPEHNHSCAPILKNFSFPQLDSCQSCRLETPVEPLLFHRVMGLSPHGSKNIEDQHIRPMCHNSLLFGVRVAVPVLEEFLCETHRSFFMRGHVYPRGHRGYPRPEPLRYVPTSTIGWQQFFSRVTQSSLSQVESQAHIIQDLRIGEVTHKGVTERFSF